VVELPLAVELPLVVELVETTRAVELPGATLVVEPVETCGQLTTPFPESA